MAFARHAERMESLTMERLKRPLSAAMMKEPSTPTPALSVAVAQPAKIAPSTTTIRKVMGKRPFHMVRQNSALVCGPNPAGSLGARLGLTTATPRM